MKSVKLGYLISRYPSVSHTFILREVLFLRDARFDIRVASINPPDRPSEQLTAEEHTEAANTFCVKKAGVGCLPRAMLGALKRHPGGCLRGLLFSVRLGGFDLRRILYGIFYFAEALLVGDRMEREGLVHLHVHFATPAATVALIAATVFAVRYSITVHGADEFYDVPGYQLAEKIAGASFICTIGKFARSQLMKISSPRYWSKFEVASLGVDPERFAPRRESLSDIFEMICVGRLVPAKGQHILAAMSRLARDGPDRRSLKQVQANGLTGSVIFEGAVNQDRIRSLYRAANLFVQPSFAEGIPVVLMEAMAMEIPIVTTFVNGIPELIRNGVDGRLVAPSDDEGLAAAIAALMDNAEERNRLGRAGRQRVLNRYHLGHNTEHLAEIFRQRLGVAA
jgi:colanic acid/amylovoran biosynthesis glycosyltransferase